MIRTAEFVSPKHPDKMCDRISDAILDACLKQDPMSRVAIETMGGHGIVTITGELTTNAFVDMKEIAQQIVEKEIGVQINVVKQSHEIAQGVDIGGAGDQGIMVGYACIDTPSMMPLEYELARGLCNYIYDECKTDGKTQVTTVCGIPTTAIASFQGASSDQLQILIKEFFRKYGYTTSDMTIMANTAGEWNIGGFDADTGLTGRKIVMDAYGPRIAVGGGAFSGKDPSKVDRSGAYMARKLACDYIRAGAKEAIVKIAYGIGLIDPVMAVAEVDGKIINIKEIEKLRPNAIIEALDLRKPIYEDTASWGHFGKQFNWDK